MEKFATQIINYYKSLSEINPNLPEDYKIINPYTNFTENKLSYAISEFYNKLYNDTKKRKIIYGSSPARRGTAITGIPFEDANHINEITGYQIHKFSISKGASNFLYEVIDKYGTKKFYNDFYMSFVCPIGIVKKNEKGNLINCNYYESKKLQSALTELIIKSLKIQNQFNIERSICYCIGSGENYQFLSLVNDRYHFFKEIVPLEHPRYIMQYNYKSKEQYLKKYLKELNREGEIEKHGR